MIKLIWKILLCSSLVENDAYFLFWCFIIHRYFISIYFLHIPVMPCCWMFYLFLTIHLSYVYLWVSFYLNLCHRHVVHITYASLNLIMFFFYYFIWVFFTQCFQNWTSHRTGKITGSWFIGPTSDRTAVEPVM